MNNFIRQCQNLYHVLSSGQKVYSLPAYGLGMLLAVHNTGRGPIAWLRGWPRPSIDAEAGEVHIQHVAVYPGVRVRCRNGGTVHIDDGSFINHHTCVQSHSRIEIGRECMISWNVLITDWARYAGEDNGRHKSEHAPIIVGDNCWIGARSLILGGTRLGDNCIVAAGSVVQGEYADGQVVHG